MVNRDDLIRDLYKTVVGQEVYQTTEDDRRYHADTNSLHNAGEVNLQKDSQRHDIPIEPDVFLPISLGTKRHLLMRDEKFLIGDTLAFREINNLKLTGSASLRTVVDVERNVPGLEEGYCIISWK